MITRNSVGLNAAFLLAAVLASTVASAKQDEQQMLHRIGWLGASVQVKLFGSEFLGELRGLGWIEGEHFMIEYQTVERGLSEQLPELAARLVSQDVDVIFSVLTASTRAAKDATSDIPIVFAVVADPVGDGLVDSLAHPGGNLTGVSNDLELLTGKVVELLRDAAPGISRVAYLWNSALGPITLRVMEATKNAAQSLGLELVSVEVQKDSDFPSAFAAIEEERVEALIVLGEPLSGRHRAEIVDFALTHRMPLMAHGTRIWPEAGALMSYSPRYAAHFRRAANLVYKVLQGSRPADLPVELPTRFELVVNLKTAKTLGLAIPSSILMFADDVIE